MKRTKRGSRKGKRAAPPTMKPAITLTEALNNPKLFGGTFASPSFWTWKVVAKLIDGIPLTEKREVELFKQCTGRTKLPAGPVRSLIVLAGRRAGKDRFKSAVSVWRGALCADWRKHQSAGEGAVVILLGADKRQAAILRKYCAGLLQAPLLAREVTRSTGEVTEFRNGGSLEIATNDARLVRGRSAVAVLGSECCHWKTDEYAVSSDEEVVGAAEPSMAMCPDGGLLMLGSSVHRKRGLMYRRYEELFGNDDSEDICWFAPSAVMNPKLPARVIDRALAKDPAKARAEYLNVWREDQAEFLPLDVVKACTDWGVRERVPIPGVKYWAADDGAGGTGKDSYALAIVHFEPDGTLVLDVARERKPRFVPAQVIAEFAALLKKYRISEVHGDNHAGGYHSSEWVKNGIVFRACKTSTSENYINALQMFLAQRFRLLDSVTLRNQLTSLERTFSAGDKEQVTHPKHGNAHDDVASAVCGAIAAALRAAELAAHESAACTGAFFDSSGCTVPGGSSLDIDGEVPTPPSSSFLEQCENFVRENKAAWAAYRAAPPPPAPPKPRLNAAVQAVSGDEAKRRQAAVNADRGTVHQIMTEPSRAWEAKPSGNAGAPWKRYITASGEIRSKPRGRWDPS
jgi:hypothetical protein